MKRLMSAIVVLTAAACIPAMAQAPDTAWVRSYNGPADGDDQGTGCAVDALGNLYVTGISHNGTNYDFLTVKYSTATGETLWTRRYNGPADGNDAGVRCAVDNSGNLYVTGASYDGTNEDDYLTIKYNAATGDTLWTRRHGALGDISNKANGCAVGGPGYLYVTGSSTDGSGNGDYLTLKYDAATGDTLWTRKYEGPAGGDDEAHDCATDPSGNLFVAGYSFNGTDYNLLTVKYAPNGDTIWTRRSANTLDDQDREMAGCATDGSGNVYVTGMCGLNAGYQNRYSVTIKYGPSGELLWTRIYDGPTNYDATMGCAVYPTGIAIYVTGTTFTGGPHDRFLTVCYDADSGSLGWDVSYLSSPGRTEYSIGCAVDSAGDLYVSGVSFDTLTWIGDYQVIKYNTALGVAGGPGSAMRIEGVRLEANTPNPFRRTTTIRYQLANPGRMSLKVYNAAGQCVRDLTPPSPPLEGRDSWVGSVVWDGRDNQGGRVASGVYLYRLEAGGEAATGRMAVVR